VCGQEGSAFDKLEYVTYVGAPDGGIPVHRRCLTEFFRQLDEMPLDDDETPF
jgi:hypothetical protein